MEYDDRSTTFIIRTDAYYGSNSYDDLPLGTVGGFFVCTLAVALFTCRVLKRYALEMFFRSFGRRVDRRRLARTSRLKKLYILYVRFIIVRRIDAVRAGTHESNISKRGEREIDAQDRNARVRYD